MGQYCEYCKQIYQNESFELSTLDGKEWVQCEGKECGRWTHVGCLENMIGKKREEIIDDKFIYHCSKCRDKICGKRSKIGLTTYNMKLREGTKKKKFVKE